MLIERRSSVRYPLALNVRYKALPKKWQDCGVGQTVDISSSGALIASEHCFAVGVKLEVALEWPAFLDGTIGLILAADAQVVRVRESSFALVFSRCEFRTRGRKTKSAAA